MPAAPSAVVSGVTLSLMIVTSNVLSCLFRYKAVERPMMPPPTMQIFIVEHEQPSNQEVNGILETSLGDENRMTC